MLIAPLKRVLDRHPQAELTIWGPRHAALASHTQVRTLPLIRDYDAFFTKFSAGQFDIGLAPLPDDEFHRGKSNNKFREYASCGLAGVYSDMSVYNASVQHEITGLLVPNEDAAWEAAIERLIVDAKLREGIAERARMYARAHFNETTTDGEWMDAISTAAARARPVAVAAAGNASAEKVVGLARFVGRLGTKIGPVFREHGLGTVLKRMWTHTIGFGQLLSWEVHRWRLQQRTSAHRERP